jgi:dTDP-4-dehydrorhamnose 3,5-epimerase
VDIRQASPTYGLHYSAVLDDETFRMLYIPEGFAHGFRTMVNETLFSYKCSAYYQPASERTILWNDPDLAIDWGLADPVLSAKDRAGSPFAGKAWI